MINVYFHDHANPFWIVLTTWDKSYRVLWFNQNYKWKYGLRFDINQFEANFSKFCRLTFASLWPVFYSISALSLAADCISE